MNKQIEKILSDTENELLENACFHELNSYCDNQIVFDYPMYWDGYSEFSDDIALETNNLLALANELEQAGFNGYLYVNDYNVKVGK